MIDRRGQSHGATDAYVASFLQNRFEDRYSIHDLDQADLNRDALAALRSDGVAYVVYSPTTPAGGCSPALPLLRALESEATLRVTFSPTNGRCTNAMFDPIDGYAALGQWDRDTTGTDRELERSTTTCETSEKVDGLGLVATEMIVIAL